MKCFGHRNIQLLSVQRLELACYNFYDNLVCQNIANNKSVVPEDNIDIFALIIASVNVAVSPRSPGSNCVITDQ